MTGDLGDDPDGDIEGYDGGFEAHLDQICCPDCHVALDEDGTCPKCGQTTLDCGMGQ